MQREENCNLWIRAKRKNNCRLFFPGITSNHSVLKSHKKSHFTKWRDAQIVV